MGHFTKHWSANLIEEVKNVVRKRVSHSPFSLFLHTKIIAHRSFKFMERYNEMDKRPPQATCVHKVATLPQKSGHWKVDDTDSSSDEEDHQPVTNSANLSMEEWKLYLNTCEDVPDDIGIVCWWGVCNMSTILVLGSKLIMYCYFSCTESATQHGRHLLVITWESWLCQCPVRGPSHRLESQYPSGAITSMLI